MVALIQTLIAVMLIPIAFASSAFNDTTHGFAPRGSNSPTIGRSGHLPITVALAASQHLVCVIPPRLLDLGQYRPLASVAEELNSHVSMEDVARNMVSVELRQSTVVLIASQSLAHVIPTRLLDLCQFQGVAGVEEELGSDVDQKNVAHQLASVELRKSIVALAVILGLPQDTNPIRGLMYADDVAVFADSEQSLLAASTAVEQWAIWWEMQFGVAKCGIISFTGHLVPRIG
ncbi:hypothetical protein BASA50_002287 [Batrachochytrium salamandrivorans]|uniref:Reverse transcriptase domain-containing protein n=1 Tax=Batrachochytrium salamandrivorans TaxID=1357716 RepID=A0ABQ8FPJ4_9FUNG|nr:hypothetical protein BASA50_002287 [Batrachochytrium salamandrivorans]